MAKAVTVANVVITTTEAELSAAGDEADRDLLVITNTGNFTVFIGPTGVTVGDGLPLRPGETFRVEATPTTAAVVWPYYGISSATGAVRVLESTLTA